MSTSREQGRLPEVSSDESVNWEELKKQLNSKNTLRYDPTLSMLGLGVEQGGLDENKNQSNPAENPPKKYRAPLKTEISPQLIEKNDKELKKTLLSYKNQVEIFWVHYTKSKETHSYQYHIILDSEFKKKLFNLCKLNPAKQKECFDLLIDINIENLYHHTITWMRRYLQDEKFSTEEAFVNGYISSLRSFVKSEKNKLEATNELSDEKNHKSNSHASSLENLDNQETAQDEKTKVIERIRAGQKELLDYWRILELERKQIEKIWKEDLELDKVEEFSPLRYRLYLCKRFLIYPHDTFFKKLMLSQFEEDHCELYFESLKNKEADAEDLIVAIDKFINKYLEQPKTKIGYADFCQKYGQLLKTFPAYDIDSLLNPPLLEEKKRERVQIRSFVQAMPIPELSFWAKLKLRIKRFFGVSDDELKPKPKIIQKKPVAVIHSNRGGFCSSIARLFCVFGKRTSEQNSSSPTPSRYNYNIVSPDDYNKPEPKEEKYSQSFSSRRYY